MRLANEEQSVISNTIYQSDADAQIFLFGSRVDDSKRGGDVDLLIETEAVVPSRVGALCQLEGALVVRLGNRKIDILLKDASTADAPIYHAARQTGVLL
jgi:predicted nucleotidyltransferase